MLGRHLLQWKQLVGYPSNAQAFRAIGISQKTWDKYTRGSGCESEVPLIIRLACAARAHGLEPWSPPKPKGK